MLSSTKIAIAHGNFALSYCSKNNIGASKAIAKTQRLPLGEAGGVSRLMRVAAKRRALGRM